MCLLQGAFDQQLWKQMGGAKNVILVWTKGCMDRFLDDADPTKQGVQRKRAMLAALLLLRTSPADFVRKEYAMALKLKKNIVPVAHEEFDWPDRSRLPFDCEGVMGINFVKCVLWQLLSVLRRVQLRFPLTHCVL